MKHDEVISVVRKAREELAARWAYDLKALLADARRRQEKSGRKIASFSSKTTTAAG
ncbi:MAG TPA: hypothetical protein PLX89_14895 [Verrucomicrobiota bacterium]|nr:hypothetical protein [Verrucomicrobiota bacterium]